jgi:hypothetical protein
MIGREDDKDEVTFKVADRRKFNPDGSVREGVVLDRVADGNAPAGERVETAEAPIGGVEEAPADNVLAEEVRGAEEPGQDDDIPGADDPASFVNFLSTLATNAAAALGAVPHPATGKRSLDLDTGKYWLDVLGMIKEKTKGNLHEQEARLLEGLLADLRMQYVTMVRATEEKLKANAAKKFSSADILGKK